MSHIDQWLEKILLTSYRHEALRSAGQEAASIASIDDIHNNSIHESSVEGQSHGQKYLSQHFSALKELGLDRQSLELFGADKTAQERLYRSLFVYCNGVNEFIADYGRINPLLRFKLWEAFFRLFQYYDPQCREMFLKYLFDTQNHNMQQTISDLEEANSKLKDENESLLQERMATEINLSSVKYEKKIQLEYLDSMRTHLLSKLQDSVEEYNALSTNHELLKQSHQEALTSLATVKDVVPQLILKLRRTTEESHRATTITENYKREYDVLLNTNKKLENQIKDLNDELAKTKRVVIEKSFVIETLQDRDKDLNDKMILNQREVDAMKKTLHDFNSIEDGYLEVIDDLVRIVESSKIKLASCWLYVHDLTNLYDTKIHLSTERDAKDDVIDQTVLELLLKESVIPSRFQLVNVNDHLQFLYDDPNDSGSKVTASEPILMPVVNSNSDLQSKRSFLQLIQPKVKLHLPLCEKSDQWLVVLPEEFPKIHDPNLCQIDDIEQQIGTTCLVDHNATDVDIPSIIDIRQPDAIANTNEIPHNLASYNSSQYSSKQSFQIPIHHSMDTVKKSVEKIMNELIYAPLPTKIIQDMPIDVAKMADELQDTLPRFKDLSAKYSVLLNKYEALLYIYNHIDSQLITQYYSRVMDERNNVSVLKNQLSESRDNISALEGILKDLRITEEKYQRLEPKFLKLVEHYQERMIAKKKIENDLSNAKIEIEDLLQSKKRLRVCEERIDVLSRELEEKTRIIMELQAEKHEWLVGLH